MRRANMNEAEEHADFVDKVGFPAAERMMQIYTMSHPVGTEYDKLMKTGCYRTKEQMFANRARSERFIPEQIEAFLELQ